MKRTVIALATLLVGQASLAQSSVTLFGVVDVAVSHYDAKSIAYSRAGVPLALTAPGSVKTSQTVLSNGSYNSSRLGFRGTEDLGGGLAASFWLESGINADSGSKGIDNFNRRSTVSLSGGFGELRLGRDYTPTFWNDTVFDPFGSNGVGSSVVFVALANLATARGAGTPAISLGGSDPYIRTSNSVGYFLPASLGGFYGQVQYAFPENVKTDNVPGTPSSRGRSVGGRFGYLNGPLDVAASYGVNTMADTTTPTLQTENRIKTFNLGASYDFGPVKLMGELVRVNDDTRTTAPILALGSLSTRDNRRYSGALIGATVPIGPGLIRASYGVVRYKSDTPVDGNPFARALEASANKIALGYVHNLSKRTALYATVSRTRIKDAANNLAVMGLQPTYATGPAFVSTGGGVAGYAPRSSTGYDFGIRHAF